MKIKLFQKGNETQQMKDAAMPPDEEYPLAGFLDGMGTGTARIIIKRHLDDNQWEKYGLKELKNTGRYYLADIVGEDGKLIDEVLVDKQSGGIQSLRRKTSAKS